MLLGLVCLWKGRPGCTICYVQLLEEGEEEDEEEEEEDDGMQTEIQIIELIFEVEVMNA